jgi:hypothetical protein
MKRKYFVLYGPDSRHFLETKAYNLLREAKKFAENLDAGKAYKIISLDFYGDWCTGKNERLIKFRYCKEEINDMKSNQFKKNLKKT